MNSVKLDDLRRRLSLDVDTGELRWLDRPASDFPSVRALHIFQARFAGKPAFRSIDKQGYLTGRFDGVLMRAHRVVWAVATGCWPIDEIDHINGDRQDNRLANLREATRRENARNCALQAKRAGARVGVGYRGDRQKWRAYIGNDNKSLHLGNFDTHEEAVEARLRAEQRLGFHPNHGRTAAP